MNEEIAAAHEEATAERSPAEIAADTEFSQISSDLDRKVLDEIAKQHGITHDALNMSPSKFKKLNKDQLVDAIKAGKPEEQAQKKETKQDDFDLLSFGASVYNFTMHGVETGDYKNLDNFLMAKVYERVSKGDSSLNINANPQLLTNLLLSGSIVYGLARMIGFENIKNKAVQVKDKILYGGTPANEPSKNKPKQD